MAVEQSVTVASSAGADRDGDSLDVYAAYECLRRYAPVLADPQANSWTVFGYHDVRAALRNPALSSAARIARMTAPLDSVCPVAGRSAGDLLSRQLETMDAPRHGVLRGQIGAEWSAAVAGVTRLIESSAQLAVTTAVIEAMGTSGPRDQVDLVRVIAEPFPLSVVLAALGVPGSDAARVAAAVSACAAGLSEAIDTSAAHTLLTDFARHATEGLVGALRRRGDVGVEDVVANIVLAVAAGHRTTSALISSALAYLLEDEAMAAEVMARRDGVVQFVDEVLRLESPVQALQREATSETMIGDTAIPRGALVTLSLGSANRDPIEFADADRVMFGRRPGRHVAFGYGAHRCLGASLARLQTAAVVSAFLASRASLELVDVQWSRTTASCSVQRLTVRPLSRAY